MTSNIFAENLKKTHQDVLNMITVLDSEKLFADNVVTDNNFDHMLNRIYLHKEAINRKFKILKELPEFLKINEKFGYDEKKFMFDFILDMALVTHFYFEMLNKFLREILDLPKLGLNQAKERVTYGAIISKLRDYKNSKNENVFVFTNLEKLFNVKMRNILGHSNWWINDKVLFSMVENDEEKSLEFKEMVEVYVSIVLLLNAFTGMYIKKFSPEEYEKIIQQNPELSLDNIQQAFESQSLQS